MTRMVEKLFEEVKPIILKSRRKYYIQLWDQEDWLQEGRIILYQLLASHPTLYEDRGRLLVYFKTKFNNYVKDVIRGQESLKRRFHKLPYEEISEVGHRLASGSLDVGESVCIREQLRVLREELSEEEGALLDKLVSGERFPGRCALLRKLKPYFIDFLD
nr:hypothetical protein [Streptococcus halichoeri]